LFAYFSLTPAFTGRATSLNMKGRDLDCQNLGYVSAKNFLLRLSSFVSSHFGTVHF